VVPYAFRSRTRELKAVIHKKTVFVQVHQGAKLNLWRGRHVQRLRGFYYVGPRNTDGYHTLRDVSYIISETETRN
jgi:hypothetical protein